MIKSKYILLVLILDYFQFSQEAFNMINIWKPGDKARQDYDCLEYVHVVENSPFPERSDLVEDKLEYCFRKENPINDREYKQNIVSHGSMISFEQLLRDKATVLDLLTWSASWDDIEEYAAYLKNPKHNGAKEYMNCTQPWFGPLCQYTFGNETINSMNDVIVWQFHSRSKVTEDISGSVSVPCYVLLECDRGGDMCLDWREVCDGFVDCLNDGVDEKFCFQLEVNICRDDEFRCTNGLCIDGELRNDPYDNGDCTDRSDMNVMTRYQQKCFQNPTFQCEEHSCSIPEISFNCGDGDCIFISQKCQNGRHLSYRNYLSEKGNISLECWMGLVCTYGFLSEVNGTHCTDLQSSSSNTEMLRECHGIFEFPTVSLLAGHVYLLQNFSGQPNTTDGIHYPLICFDQELCEFPEFEHIAGNRTCIQWDPSYIGPIGIGLATLPVTFKRCISSYWYKHDQDNYEQAETLHKCEGSSKLINKGRLVDAVNDCLGDDDEDYENSCSLGDPYRSRCTGKDACTVVPQRVMGCINAPDEGAIPFHQVCDSRGWHMTLSDYDIPQRDNCLHWPCNNLYTRCNGYWNCEDGSDEENCYETRCPKQTVPCIYKHNLSFICLPSDRVNDDTIDCIGGSDRPYPCILKNNPLKYTNRFLCVEDEACISQNSVCNGVKDCKDGSDEIACKNQDLQCSTTREADRDNYSFIMCGLFEHEKKAVRHFNIDTCKPYPSIVAQNILVNTDALYERYMWNQATTVSVERFQPPWYCHRGIRLGVSFNNTESKHECICPPSYYGDRCQFQNQRVGVTLQLTSKNRGYTYGIVMMLLDENDWSQQVISFKQYQYSVDSACSVKINRYLSFSERPKNDSKHYMVRVDVIEKVSMLYIGSWYYPIKFNFLPVQRIAAALHVPLLATKSSPMHSVPCENGQIVKYMNENKYFCRCFSGWTGLRCHIQISNASCFNGSIVVGISEHRAICVCEIYQHGSQCSVKFQCPVDQCLNGGQCVPSDDTDGRAPYTCICNENYFGSNCEYSKLEVSVDLDIDNIPAYVIGFLATTFNNTDPIVSNVVEKLTLFQRRIIFRIYIIFNMMILKANNHLYLAVLQHSPVQSLHTSINERQRCRTLAEVFNQTILDADLIDRLELYQLPCMRNDDLQCFHGDGYFCVCTTERHTNCMQFTEQNQFSCSTNDMCENSFKCLQDAPRCPRKKICLCNDCFFGDTCQFYAKGLGSSLDEILGYEIKHNTPLSRQTFRVHIATIITMILFTIGTVGSILCIIIFTRPQSQEVGCGAYLLASSVSSLVVTNLFVLKFWLLLLSQQTFSGRYYITHLNCLIIEPFLKATIHLDNWFNACVAIERAVAVAKGIDFDKRNSKKASKFIIIVLLFGVVSLYLPQFMHLQVFEDDIENRSWCVVAYQPWLHFYSMSLIFVHYFVPLLLNVVSTLSIIFVTANRRITTQAKLTYFRQFLSKLRKYKHLIISPTIIVLLTLPYLIISIILDCDKSSKLFWFYLVGYFLSHVPSVSIFFIFVLPSPLYRQQLKRVKSRAIHYLYAKH